MAIDSLNTSFYADPKSLTALKREAGAQTPAAVRETAKQFESLFTTMMLKSMRQASPKDSLFGSDQQDFYQDMFDQQLSVQLSKGKGMGLADVLVRQLMQGMSSEDPATAGALGAAVSKGAASGATDAAATSTATPTARTWPPRTAEDFVQAILPAATAAGRALGVDPSTVIAHAALETGWGKSVPVGADGKPSFNLFGIKAGGAWKGDSSSASTNEYQGGQMQQVTADFRSYASPEQSVNDYVKLLQGSPRYASALGTGSDAAAFGQALQRGGYATDPDYASKLSAVAARLKSQAGVPISTSGAG